MSEGNGKKWYKNIWIWMIILGVVFFVVNIVLSCIFRKEGPNIFTAISGWVSGIATCIIGVISYLQSKEYSETNKINLLSIQITDFMSELQRYYLTDIQMEKIIDYRANNIAFKNKKNITRQEKEEFKLKQSDEAFIIYRSFLHFEPILYKGNYSADKIIKIHQNNQWFQENLDKIDNIGKETLFQHIRESDNLINSIIKELQNLRLDLFNSRDKRSLIEKCSEEEQKIITYFKKVAEGRINEQTQNSING